MDLPPGAEDLRRSVRTWARHLDAGQLAAAAEAGALPVRVLGELLGLGLQRAPFPASGGGSGLGMAAYGAGLQELAAVDSSLAATVMASVSAATLLHRCGTDRQRDRWLEPVLAGRGVAAIALSEPGGGSDLAHTTAEAAPAGDGWRLSGEKRFITNAASPLLRVIVTLGRSPEGLCCLAVDAETPGLEVSGPLASIGWAAASLGDVSFRRCPLPADALLGPPGRGLPPVLGALTYGRVAVAAIGAGLATGSWERALARARRGRAGAPALGHEAVRAHLVDMWCRATAAALMAAEAARACDAPGDPRGLATIAAMAKLASSEAAVANARSALQVFGSDGARRGGAVARLWGDAKVLEVAEGTSEVQRLVIGRALDGVNVEETPSGLPGACGEPGADGLGP